MNHKMNAGRAYLLFALSLLLPWFTYNAKVMGYCHGYEFLRWLVVPMVVLAICLVRSRRDWLSAVLCELSLVVVLAVLVMAFGSWRQVHNIVSGFQWDVGFRTAVPTFYLSVILFLVLAVMTQLALFSKEKSPGKKM